MTLARQGFLHSKFEVLVMRNKEIKPILIGVDIATRERDYSAIAISIKAIREDERKVQLDKFSTRLDSIVCKATREKLTREQILELLAGESVHLSNLAAELDHV
ncbi:hypothetical protein PROVRUST_07255 [Providencia rustigianii DSM 4541]|uniref:Uncharacterized protein n=2 Tax=Providencia rustigianii TaxID=158850 RepID=D1P4V1_9GAMM|nr:hypothetical protein PROVRUST_07255 [Providencia rustigianii DSM 4541]